MICVLHLERQLHVTRHHVTVFAHHLVIIKYASWHVRVAFSIWSIALRSCKLCRVVLWVTKTVPWEVRSHLLELTYWHLWWDLDRCRKLFVLLWRWQSVVICKHMITALHRRHHLFDLVRRYHLRRLLWGLLVCEQLLFQYFFSQLLFLEAHLKLHRLLNFLTLFSLMCTIRWELHIDRLVRVWLGLHRIRVKWDCLTIRWYLNFQLLHLVLLASTLISFLPFIGALIKLRICGKLQIH